MNKRECLSLYILNKKWISLLLGHGHEFTVDLITISKQVRSDRVQFSTIENELGPLLYPYTILA